MESVPQEGSLEEFCNSDSVHSKFDILPHQANPHSRRQQPNQARKGFSSKLKKARARIQTLNNESKSMKRLRKNQDQNQILIDEFNVNANWSKDKIVKLAQRVGLKQSQIYKWNWDMQRKLRGSTQSTLTLDMVTSMKEGSTTALD